MSDRKPSHPPAVGLDPGGFDRLEQACAARGPAAMCEELAASLAARGRWHAVFDLRLVQARLTLGLPVGGPPETIDEAARDRLDALSLAACREVGWPLLEAGQVAAGWMYLRAAAEEGEVAARLAPLADRVLTAADPADEESARLIDELLGVALWESADPALGIRLMLGTQGTCNAITAYEQAISRLPAIRQEPAAGLLVAHLHAEVVRSLAADLEARGIDTSAATTSETPLVALLEAAALEDDFGIHVDVSHLQSVLRMGRVCGDEPTVRRCWELACYGCRLPTEVCYPGEPPFENVAEASRLFFGGQLGRDVAAAVAFFRRAAAAADPARAGSLPTDTLVLLLARLGRPGEALAAAVERPREGGPPSGMAAAGLLPPLVEMARGGGAWDILLEACRRHGDEVTFAAALAARAAGPESPRESERPPDQAP